MNENKRARTNKPRSAKSHVLNKFARAAEIKRWRKGVRGKSLKALRKNKMSAEKRSVLKERRRLEKQNKQLERLAGQETFLLKNDWEKIDHGGIPVWKCAREDDIYALTLAHAYRLQIKWNT